MNHHNMGKIILTGNETKPQLQKLMEDKVQYSKVDSKQKLLERIDKYNNTIQEEVVIKKQEPIVEEEIVGSVITGSQYCNIKGQNKRVKFFINKKYKDERYPQGEWDEIFKKEGLV